MTDLLLFMFFPDPFGLKAPPKTLPHKNKNDLCSRTSHSVVNLKTSFTGRYLFYDRFTLVTAHGTQPRNHSHAAPSCAASNFKTQLISCNLERYVATWNVSVLPQNGSSFKAYQSMPNRGFPPFDTSIVTKVKLFFRKTKFSCIFIQQKFPVLRCD